MITRLRHTRLAALAALLAVTVSGAALAQNLTIGVRAGPDSIDPHFTATGTHAESLKHVFDTLTWSGDKLQIEPRLALSWKAIEPSVWEFKLRPGVKFHDGSDFTAEDVKFSIERIPVVCRPQPDDDLCAPGQGGEDRRSADRAHRHRRPGAEPAQRFHPPLHRLAQGGRRPDQGDRQRGLQFRQGRDRHRPLQVRLLDAEGPDGAGALRRLLGPQGALGAGHPQGTAQ